MPHCKHHDNGSWCPFGCKSEQFVCHRFAQGRLCHYGDACHYVHVQKSDSSRSGRSQRDEEHRGFFTDRSSAGFSRSSSEARALKLLGLDQTGDNVSISLVKAAYKLKALEAHPDKAGPHGHQRMTEINNARDLLVRSFAQSQGS